MNCPVKPEVSRGAFLYRIFNIPESWHSLEGRARLCIMNHGADANALQSPACAIVCLAFFYMLLVFPGWLAAAQENPEGLRELASTSPPMLDELEITGSNNTVTQTGDVVGEEHTGSRGKVTWARLSQPGSQLGDLLSGVSGVQQKQSGGFGTFSNITVRAASAAQTAVYLDGILLNTGGESVIDLSTLEILNLASVDVYKGSTPLQLGHASMGGAVNLNTMRFGGQPDSRIRLGLGSFSHLSLLAAHQGNTENWDWTATLSRQQSDNDFPFTNNNATPLNPDDDERQRRRNNQVERTSVLLKTGHQGSANRRTDLLLQIADRETGVATARNTIADQASYETLKSQVQLSQVIDKWYGWNSRHTLYWHLSDSVYDDSLSQVGLGDQYIDTDIRTLGAKTYWERFLDLGTVGLSIDFRNESLDLEDELNADENFTADRQLITATSHLAILDEKERWMIAPALRWQQSQRLGTSTSLGVPASLPEQNESELGLQIGLSYSINPLLSVNANAGNYFREPAFTELYGSIGLINGNPALEPESGINADIGVSYDTDKLQLGMTYFQNRHDNLILNSFDARGIGRPGNTGKADINGLELSAQWIPAPDWRITASATIQNPRNRDPFKGYKDKILPGESKRTGFVRLAYRRTNVAYWCEWQVAADKFYDSTNLLPAADTSVHSVGMNLERKRWNLSLRIQNLGDDIIEDFNGFPKPGRSFFIALIQKL
ncbi:MAG: TonB-dependent receptor [Granulosicoccus sp.]